MNAFRLVAACITLATLVPVVNVVGHPGPHAATQNYVAEPYHERLCGTPAPGLGSAKFSFNDDHNRAPAEAGVRGAPPRP